MSGLILFSAIEVVVLFTPAFFIFKNAREYFDCLFSFLCGGYFVFWKRLWKIHFGRSMKFAGYLSIVLIASWLNINFFCDWQQL